MDISTSKKWSRLPIIYSGAITLLVISAASLLRWIVFDGGIKTVDWLRFLVFLVFYAIIVLALFVLYAFMAKGKQEKKHLATFTSIVCFCYWICIFSAQIDVFAMPLFLCAVLITALFEERLGFVCNVLVMLLVALNLTQGNVAKIPRIDVLAGIVASILGSCIIVGRLNKTINRLNNIILLILAGLVTTGIMFAANFLGGNDIYTAVERLGFMFLGIGLQLLLSLCLTPLLENVFNLITNQRLVELCDYRQPLLERLEKEAPGTFNHVLTVANLAETCASAIGENPYVARAAAFYHDVGKLNNATYFTENQASGFNPHDDLMPEISRDIIISHTSGGYELCKKYRIPDELARVTIEHHGTLPIVLFYNKAKQLTDGEVDMSEYAYPGPIPTTKIAALIMICDACEAAIRSMSNPTAQKIDELVKLLINYRLNFGQFDSCDITMQDLNVIRKTIVDALGGVYHQRIAYNLK